MIGGAFAPTNDDSELDMDEGMGLRKALITRLLKADVGPSV